MNTDNVTVAGLLSIIFVLATQVIKKWKPEKFDEYAKYVTFSLIVLGALLSLIYFLAFNTPIVAENTWQMVWAVFTQLVLGALAGAGSSGLYEAMRNTPLSDEFKPAHLLVYERSPKANTKRRVKKVV